MTERRGFISFEWIKVGTKGNDYLEADKQGRLILGHSGEDELLSHFSDVWLHGGKDNDTLITEVGSVEPTTGPNGPAEAMAKQTGGHGNDEFFSSLHAVYSEYGQNVTASNCIFGGSGEDDIGTETKPIYAYANSVLGTAKAINFIHGGRDADTIHAVAEIEQNSAPDVSIAMNEIFGGEGDDHITALADGDFQGDVSNASNVVKGGRGDDFVEAKAIVQSNSSEEARNTIDGGKGDDELYAETLTDSNTGSPTGLNVMFGRGGNDMLTATHRVDGENWTTDVTNELSGGAGNDILKGYITAEDGNGEVTTLAEDSAIVRNILKGGNGHDDLYGAITAKISEHQDTIARNILYGGQGDDALQVSGGTNNSLYGGAGNDRIAGGDGDDRLEGNAGADTFAYDISLDSGMDRITDFNSTEDRLNFTNLFGVVSDEGAPGLVNDIHLISTLTDGGLGGDVILELDSGTRIVFEGIGTGAIVSIGDLVDDPASQIVSEPNWFDA